MHATQSLPIPVSIITAKESGTFMLLLTIEALILFLTYITDPPPQLISFLEELIVKFRSCLNIEKPSI